MRKSGPTMVGLYEGHYVIANDVVERKNFRIYPLYCFQDSTLVSSVQSLVDDMLHLATKSIYS